MGDSDWMVLCYGPSALGAPYGYHDSGAGPFDTEAQAFEFAKREYPEHDFIVVPGNAMAWDEPEEDPFWLDPILRAGREAA